MNHTKRDRILIFAILLALVTFLWIMIEAKSEKVLAGAARTHIILDIIQDNTNLGWKPWDFGGCPVATAKHTTTEVATTEPITEAPKPTAVHQAPVSDVIFNEATETDAEEEATVSTSRSLGVFKCTAYCGCYSCSEGYGNMTATGVRARAYHTIAVDPSVIPYGTWVVINGNYYRAEDCGGGVRGNHIDIYFDNHYECEQFGLRYLEVFAG